MSRTGLKAGFLLTIVCMASCGSSEDGAASDDSMTAGAGGGTAMVASGTGGLAGTGGSAGNGGGGGAQMTTGGAGGMTAPPPGGSPAVPGPREPCPEAPPVSGTDCELLAQTCSYGDDPRGPRCRDRAVCTVSGWVFGTPSCEPLPSVSCPSSLDGSQGAPCSADGAVCADGTMRCVCTSCVKEVVPVCEGGSCSDETIVSCTGSELAWMCGESGGTTPAPPNLGTECEADARVDYFDAECMREAQLLCLRDVWIAWNDRSFGGCSETLVEPGELCPSTAPEHATACPVELGTSEYFACDYGCETFQCSGGAWLGGVLANCP